MTTAVTLDFVGEIGVVVIDNPPVNALSHPVRAGLLDAVRAAESNVNLKALVVICAGRTFIAGADIREFGKPMKEPVLHAVIAALEGCSKPIIAAIHGTALGGGLEVALGCHYRIATADARTGVPEVKLGIIPGAGGTQRLPRLAGLEAALRLVSQGDEIKAAEALSLGILDRIAAGDLKAEAIDYANMLVRVADAPRRVGDLPMPPHDPDVVEAARTAAKRKRRGWLSPQAAIDAVELGYSHSLPEALEREYALCRELLGGPQSRALRHVFAAERIAVKPPQSSEAVAERSIGSVAVVGAGPMGLGISMAFANAGMPVQLLERTQETVDRALSTLRKRYLAQVERGSLTAQVAEGRLALITGATAYDQIAEVDLVVEAVTEDMEIKKDVFRRLDAALRPGVILASNTSYLDIDQLAAETRRPRDVCGMHFFNPAEIMRLVENVRAAESAPDVVATIQAVGKRLKKLPVVTGVCDGFLVNRMLSKRSRECYFLLEEGAAPRAIDAALSGFGFPLGPFALADLAGIDVQFAARKARYPTLTDRERRADFVDQMAGRGRYGQKTGAGWYLYDDKRKARHDPNVDVLIRDHLQAHRLTPRDIGETEILERTLYAMVNEGARILDEGIVARPHDIDAAMINGIGFPSYRGGPMFWADEIGLDKILATLRRFAAEHGDAYWRPSPLIERSVAAGRGFYSE